jgi:hypothetical protein
MEEGSEEASNGPIRLLQLNFDRKEKLSPGLRKKMNSFIVGAIGEFIASTCWFLF